MDSSFSSPQNIRIPQCFATKLLSTPYSVYSLTVILSFPIGSIGIYMLMIIKYISLVQTSFLSFRFICSTVYWVSTFECLTCTLNQYVLGWTLYFMLPKLVVFSIFFNSTTKHKTAKPWALYIILDSFISLTNDSTVFYFLILCKILSFLYFLLQHLSYSLI